MDRVPHSWSYDMTRAYEKGFKDGFFGLEGSAPEPVDAPGPPFSACYAQGYNNGARKAEERERRAKVTR